VKKLIPVALMGALTLGFIALEAHHHLKYGHFFPLGLHADVTDFRGDIGPAELIFFDAHLTNFGLYPREIERCEFVSDANTHEVSVAYRVEHFEDGTHSWKTVVDSAQDFCRPRPVAIIRAKLVRKWLWTGQTLSTGARAMDESDVVAGNTMRFIIEANGRQFPTGPCAAIATGALSIFTW
jgi:hypothetical protein